MPKITIDNRGIIEELPLEPTTLTIEHLADSANPLMSVNSVGLIQTGSLANNVRFTYHEHGGGAQIASGSVNFVVMAIDGQRDSYDGGLAVWNTGSNVFMPEAINTVYTLRVAGQITPASGNPYFHVDFILSGSDPNTSVGFRHHQSWETIVKNNADHIHVHAIFTVFADEDLFVSGGQVKMTTDGKALTLNSASIFIKES